MNDHQVGRAPVVPERISAWTIVALLAVAVIPLSVIFYSVSDAESARKAWRAACLVPEKEKIDVSGQVRLRDGGFYLEAGAATHYLGKSCDGKYGRACLESNPGKGLLSNHVGQPVSATLCDGEVLSYRVAGSAFYK